MIAGDSKNGTSKPAENPSVEGRRIELQIQTFPLLVWPHYLQSRPGVENGITKIDYHLYPVRATSSFLLLFLLILLLLLFLFTCYMFFFCLGYAQCVQGVPRGFQPRWP
jgi:hypothetical protein